MLYTIFCCAHDHEVGDTIHINTVEAEDSIKAAIAGRTQCAGDWDCKEKEVVVLGVAEGSLPLAEWCDSGIELPAPQELLSIKIDFDAWPGAPFRGGKIIEIDREAFVDDGKFEAAFLPEVEELLEGLAEDDIGGELATQIKKAAYATLDAWEGEGKEKRISLVLASGRYKLDGDGEPLRDHRGQEIFDEQFDITVSIIPVIGDEPDDD